MLVLMLMFCTESGGPRHSQVHQTQLDWSRLDTVMLIDGSGGNGELGWLEDKRLGLVGRYVLGWRGEIKWKVRRGLGR